MYLCTCMYTYVHIYAGICSGLWGNAFQALGLVSNDARRGVQAYVLFGHAILV